MAAHRNHQHVHLRHGKRHVQLPRVPDPQDIGDSVETVIQIVYETAKQTFDGPAALVTPTIAVGSPAQQTQPPQPDPKPSETSQDKNDDDQDAPNSATDSEPTIISAPASDIIPSATILLTDGPHATSSVRSSISQASEATSAPSSSSSAPASPMSGGMSAGGTAGLVIGVLLLAGAALAFILFCIKKKKRDAQKERQPIDDVENEKNDFFGVAPSPNIGGSSESVRTARTHAEAPRLSLRPVTEFDPALEEKRRSAANALEMASAPTAGGMLAPTAAKPTVSAWERPGADKQQQADPFSDPVNPFGNQAETPRSPTGPLPNSPSASGVSSTFVEDSDVAAGATGAAVVVAGAAAGVADRKPLPSQPEQQEKATTERRPVPEQSGSPNPAWVEDVPVSPGPAPTGPPPIAVAGTGSAPDNVHRVQLDFKPSMDDELEIRAGQLVRMLHEYDDGWALCIRMDRSRQGVVPRSCLSKMPVKPRQGPPPQMRRPGPPRGPTGPGVPRPLTPGSGRNSPAQGRPMSPASRPRANSNAQQRSMSPGPYGGGPQQMLSQQGGRRRSNSAATMQNRRQSPPSPLNPSSQSSERKPVPGMAL